MQCKRSRFWIFLSCDSCVTWHPLISCAIQWHPGICSPGCSRWQAILDIASRRLGTASSWPLAELFAKTELERTLGRGLKSDFQAPFELQLFRSPLGTTFQMTTPRLACVSPIFETRCMFSGIECKSNAFLFSFGFGVLKKVAVAAASPVRPSFEFRDLNLQTFRLSVCLLTYFRQKCK